MDLSLLATRQKRIKDWTDFVTEGGVQDPSLKTKVIETIAQLKKAIVQCWENQKVTAEDEKVIEDLERQLQQLNEESRMTVVGKKSGSPQRVI